MKDTRLDAESVTHYRSSATHCGSRLEFPSRAFNLVAVSPPTKTDYQAISESNISRISRKCLQVELLISYFVAISGPLNPARQ
jgi:hypothetical protein